MSDLARRLRRAREARGITLDEAERATKIRRRFLEAIDAGDFARLPDGPPARGFIKIYARYLGLDAEQALGDFEAEVGVPITQLNEVVPPPPERQPIVSRYTQTVKLPQVRWKGELPSPSQAELDLMADEVDDNQPTDSMARAGALTLRRSEIIARQNQRSAFQSSFSLRPLKTRRELEAVSVPRLPGYRTGEAALPVSQLLKIAAIAGGAIVIVLVVSLVILPALRPGAPSQSAVGAPTVFPVTLLPQPTLESVAPAQPDSDQPNPASQPAGQPAQPAPVIQPLPGGGVEMVLDARERAWVRVLVDGNVVYEGISAIGPNIRWRANRTVGFETGNAGAFEVIINGTR
ncbi:MAG: RodZ domain-containing protein, partial [Anaerolineae bacterium]